MAFSGAFLDPLASCNDGPLDEADKSNDKGADSNGSKVVDVGQFDAQANLSFSLVFLSLKTVIEVVSGRRKDDNHVSEVLNEGKKPEGREHHECS